MFYVKATVIILITASLVVTSRQYIGDPIDCIVEGIPLRKFTYYKIRPKKYCSLIVINFYLFRIEKPNALKLTLISQNIVFNILVSKLQS